MKVSKKLQRIRKENAKFEKKAPYNFCDRWCQRCTTNRQLRCRLYQSEPEQKLTCIAYGRKEYDPQVIEELMKRQFADIEGKLAKFLEENDINFEDIEDREFFDEEEREKFAQNHPLRKTAENYYQKACHFLNEVLYPPSQKTTPIHMGPHKKKNLDSKLKYNLETVSWYHTLLPAKLHRALWGFYRHQEEDEIILCDTVAQFSICRKAAKKSLTALRRLRKLLPSYFSSITELIVLLGNIHSRINILEETI